MAEDMISLPVIGISTRSIPQNGGSHAFGAAQNYIKAIEDSGASALLIPVLPNERALRSSLERLDGIVFSGGEDIEPLHYGEQPHAKLGTTSGSRDLAELFCFREAFARKLPILGICRGLQLINVALGGTLFQDLPSQRPSSVGTCTVGTNSVGHLLPEGADLPLEAATHPLKIDPASALAKILSTTTIPANSRHHQAVKELGTGLSANAWTEDGLVEGFELRPQSHAGQFLVAVQCHPERIYETTVPEWKGLFEGFTAAADSFKRRR
jgi:putative glutamine amidotransferase